MAERLKIQEKNAKLLNVDVEQMKELDKDMDSKRIDQFYQSYRGIMQLAINMIDMGKGAGGSVTIKVADKFKVEELFEELYEGKNKSFIFKPIDSKYENVAGKILRDWNIVFDTSKISKLKSVKQETEAVDWGGPSKEFMSLVWKRHWHSTDIEKGSRLMIPSTALPPFYRQCKWANTWPWPFSMPTSLCNSKCVTLASFFFYILLLRFTQGVQAGR